VLLRSTHARIQPQRPAHVVAAVGLEELVDSSISHVPLAPNRGSILGDIGVNLGVCVRVVNPLNIHDDHPSLCVLVREMTESLGSVSVIRAHEAEVVAVLLVVSLKVGLGNHNRMASGMISWSLNEFQDASIDERDLLRHTQLIESVGKPLTLLLHHHGVKSLLPSFFAAFCDFAHERLLAMWGRLVDELVNKSICPLSNWSRGNLDHNTLHVPALSRVVVLVPQCLLRSAQLAEGLSQGPSDVRWC
jgi:hypothetical protein